MSTVGEAFLPAGRVERLISDQRRQADQLPMPDRRLHV